jgi:hypothetical protein
MLWTGHIAFMRVEIMNVHKILMRKLLANRNLANQEDQWITLRWNLGKQIARMGGRWNWLRIMYNCSL